jgi:hypothetical protein
MVPAFFSWLHPILPLGNLIDAMRSIFYFDGTDMIRPTLVLCAWIVVGAALVTASALLPGSSGAADGDGGDGEATDRAVRELPGPAMAVEPSAIESPAGRAALRETARTASGRARPCSSARSPTPAAPPYRRPTSPSSTPTATGAAHYHRAPRPLRRRWPPRGSPHRIGVPGRPDAHRDPVMLAADIPARQDFVIPDPTQGIAAWPG